MSVSAYALCTLAGLETYLGLESGDHDAGLENLIDAVSAASEAYTGRKLAARDYSWRKNGNGETLMLVDEWPLNSITTLKINGVTIAESSTPELGTAGYRIDSVAGIIRLIGYVFSRGIDNIEINANAGYAAIPGDLAQAAIEWAAWKYKESNLADVGVGVLGKTQEERPANQGTTTFWTSGSDKNIPPNVKWVLDRYKRAGGL